MEIKPAELKMAGQVVESMADDFHPEQFTDTYQEQLKELVEAKLQGGEAFSTEDQPAQLDETEDVSDLWPNSRPVCASGAESGRRATDGQAAAKQAPAHKAPAKKHPQRRRPLRKAPAKKAAAKK